MRAWTEIGDSVRAHGLPQAGLHQFARRQRAGHRHRRARIAECEHRMLAVHAAWHRLGLPDGMFSAEERAHGIHGGEVETSLMLTFRPHTVQDDRRRAISPARRSASSAR